ncbi:MAG TPA: amidohydrolase family protein [Chloroflexota bacterium]
MRVIDVHIHWSPKSLMADNLAQLTSPDAKLTRYTDGVPSYTVHNQIHDLDRHLAMMDHAGLDVAVISSAEGMPGNLERSKIVNDELAREVSRREGRIVGMGHTGPLAGKAGLDELDRCWQELGLRGVAIASTLSGRGLDAEELYPFYEHCQAAGQFIFVHPTLACGTLGSQGFQAYDLFRTVGREFELVTAVMRLVCGGVLDEFPKLNIIMSHFGGGITSLVGRIRDYQDKEFWGLLGDPVHGKKPKHDFDSYLGRLYFDTGGHFGEITAVKAALLNIPASNILFGTDYPQEIRGQDKVKAFVETLKALELPPDQIEAILGGNAAKIVGL